MRIKTYKTLGLAIGLSLFASGCANAQQHHPSPVAPKRIPAEAVELGAESSMPKRGPALWKVSDEDTTIYLFGTIHILPEGIQWYKGPIREALETSDTLVTEISMTDKEGPKAAQLSMEKGLYQNGKTLRSVLTPEEKAIYEKGLASIGLPPAALDAMEPWFAAMNLAFIPLMQQGYDPAQGVEKQLIDYAGSSKQFGALETLEYQLGIFDTMPEKDQINFLIAGVDEIGSIKQTIDSMVVDWVEGDTDGLADLLNTDLEQDANLAELILYKRNQNWATWIDNRLDKPGTVFIAVGAGHLAGKKSVQEVLAKKGTKAVRIQ